MHDSAIINVSHEFASRIYFTSLVYFKEFFYFYIGIFSPSQRTELRNVIECFQLFYVHFWGKFSYTFALIIFSAFNVLFIIFHATVLEKFLFNYIYLFSCAQKYGMWLCNRMKFTEKVIKGSEDVSSFYGIKWNETIPADISHCNQRRLELNARNKLPLYKKIIKCRKHQRNYDNIRIMWIIINYYF